MPSDLPPSPNSAPPGKPPPRRRPGPGLGVNWIWLVIFVLVGLMIYVGTINTAATIDWGDFIALIYHTKKEKESDGKEVKDADGKVKEVLVNGKPVYDGYTFLKRVDFVGQTSVTGEITDPKELPPDLGYLKEKLKGKHFTVQRLLANQDKELQDRLRDLEAESPRNDAGQPTFTWGQQGEPFGLLQMALMWILPFALIAGFILFLLPRFRDPLGGGFLNNYIKSPARRYERGKQRTTFDDVAGMQNAKGELQEVVEFLKDPHKFQRLGAVVPKGVLLVGPPGTGKTLLARAVAGEAGVPFYSISGSEFIQMFVGVGASRVRDMFKTAKENAPCILFIDEIDAVGRMRGAGVGGGSDEREQTLNQILSEMDGFTPTETVIVMAATNRPDVLDSALLRPGRFDRHITIDRPTWQGRTAILKVHTRNKPLADDLNLEQIARNAIGMTGADLRNLANEAALQATREGKTKIDRMDFERAWDRVLLGAKREEVVTPEGKRKTAYHEVGHALVGFLEPTGDPPSKVSIIPRGRGLGVTLTPPDEDRHHHGLDYWRARLAMTLGGRAADRLVYGQAYSGHEDDLKQATRIARYMVTHWGMSDRLGPMSFRVGEEHVFLGKEIQEPKDFSEGTALIIDEEVQRILREADDRAYHLLESHRAEMERLVDALVQREELLREEIEQILKEEGANGVAAAPGLGVMRKE